MIKLLKRIKKRFQKVQSFSEIDRIFIAGDKEQVLRTKGIRNIPIAKHRIGGKASYAEWAHVVGIFQTIFYEHLNEQSNNNILDIGCGTGLLSMASEPFISPQGKYLGLDVIEENILFANKNYKNPLVSFQHFNVKNLSYASHQKATQIPWPISGQSIEMVTALSVWTHLNQEDAIFYFCEVARVLKKGGIAVITFFYLDDLYKGSLHERSDNIGRYHSTNQLKWVFDKKAYNSSNWFTPSWTKVPEDAIAIDETGMKILLERSGLSIKKNYPGNWKERPGVYFQDILVLQKNKEL